MRNGGGKAGQSVFEGEGDRDGGECGAATLFGGSGIKFVMRPTASFIRWALDP
jgi:hypothetical protein